MARKPDQQCGHRGEVDKARQLVQCRVLNHELVLVVEAADLCRQDDEGSEHQIERPQPESADHLERHGHCCERHQRIGQCEQAAVGPFAPARVTQAVGVGVHAMALAKLGQLMERIAGPQRRDRERRLTGRCRQGTLVSGNALGAVSAGSSRSTVVLVADTAAGPRSERGGGARATRTSGARYGRPPPARVRSSVVLSESRSHPSILRYVDDHAAFVSLLEPSPPEVSRSRPSQFAFKPC